MFGLGTEVKRTVAAPEDVQCDFPIVQPVWCLVLFQLDWQEDKCKYCSVVLRYTTLPMTHVSLSFELLSDG